MGVTILEDSACHWILEMGSRETADNWWRAILCVYLSCYYLFLSSFVYLCISCCLHSRWSPIIYLCVYVCYFILFTWMPHIYFQVILHIFYEILRCIQPPFLLLPSLIHLFSIYLFHSFLSVFFHFSLVTHIWPLSIILFLHICSKD